MYIIKLTQMRRCRQPLSLGSLSQASAPPLEDVLVSPERHNTGYHVVHIRSYPWKQHIITN